MSHDQCTEIHSYRMDRLFLSYSSILPPRCFLIELFKHDPFLHHQEVMKPFFVTVSAWVASVFWYKQRTNTTFFLFVWSSCRLVSSKTKNNEARRQVTWVTNSINVGLLVSIKNRTQMYWLWIWIVWKKNWQWN